MALKTMKVTLGGKEVTATELTIGQFKKFQAGTDDAEMSEVDAGMLLASLALGMSIEEIDALPISDMMEVTKVSEWIGETISPS